MTHCFVGLLGARASGMGKLWLLSFFCSVLPDVDGIITRLSPIFFDVRISGMLWSHRGFSHSLMFALVVGILAALYAQKITRHQKPLPLLILYFFGLTAFHGLIDATTHGGQGVMFFAPLHDGRYLFLFAPVPTLRARQWIGSQGLITFGQEILWIWLPLAVAYIGFRLFQKSQA